MKLVNADNLDYIRVSNHGLFKVGERNVPQEYSAVTSPIKIKFDKDILALFYANIAEDGKREITYSVLHSTQRKFKDEYVKDVILKSTSYDADRAILHFNH
mgnify:CR=1 FL=1